MARRTDRRAVGGFTVLDGAAMVAGAAVASVHVRGVLRDEPAGPGWVPLWGTFVWVALTSAGPFLYLARRYARRLPDYPRVGDRLWASARAPLARLTVLLTASPGRRAAGSGTALAPGPGARLAVASVIALVVVWTTWVIGPAGTGRARRSRPPWTNRVGLVLAVAWPIQCGVGMVVIG